MKRLIVYDLDGTLVDTLQDITSAANHMLAQLGAPALEAQQIRRLIGRGVQQLVADCLGTQDAGRISEGLAVYRAYYAQHLADHSRLYPGARDALDHFRDRIQAVLTNKPNPYSVKLLEALKVRSYFVQVIGGDLASLRKPNPAALQALMQGLGIAPSDTLFIGDSEIDLQTGRGAGVLTVAVGHGLTDPQELAQAKPDVFVPDFAGLLVRARQEGW